MIKLEKIIRLSPQKTKTRRIRQVANENVFSRSIKNYAKARKSTFCAFLSGQHKKLMTLCLACHEKFFFSLRERRGFRSLLRTLIQILFKRANSEGEIMVDPWVRGSRIENIWKVKSKFWNPWNRVASILCQWKAGLWSRPHFLERSGTIFIFRGAPVFGPGLRSLVGKILLKNDFS